MVTAGYFFTKGFETMTKRELLRQFTKKKQDPTRIPFCVDPCPVKKETVNAPKVAMTTPEIFVQFLASVFKRTVMTTVIIGCVVCQIEAMWAGEKDRPTMKKTWLKNMHNPTTNKRPKSSFLTKPERVMAYEWHLISTNYADCKENETRKELPIEGKDERRHLV